MQQMGSKQVWLNKTEEKPSGWIPLEDLEEITYVPKPPTRKPKRKPKKETRK